MTVEPRTNPYLAPAGVHEPDATGSTLSGLSRLLSAIRILTKSAAYGVIAFLIPILIGTIGLAFWRMTQSPNGYEPRITNEVMSISAAVGTVCALFAVPLYLRYAFTRREDGDD